MPDDFTGSRVTDVVLWLASVVGAVGVLGGVVWWLILPRVREWFAELVVEVAGVRHQLSDDEDGTVGRHARVAARAVTEIPAMRREIQALANRQADLDEWKRRADIRLGSVEGALLALLGPELRRRWLSDLAGTEPAETEGTTHD